MSSSAPSAEPSGPPNASSNRRRLNLRTLTPEERYTREPAPSVDNPSAITSDPRSAKSVIVFRGESSATSAGRRKTRKYKKQRKTRKHRKQRK